jgi:hypothetical protein
VAVIAGEVSYSHIMALGLRTGHTIADSRLLPLAVDGLIVAGSVILLAGSPLGWLGVALGIGATVFANVESGLPHGALAATVAAWPAIAFSVATFVLERWLKSQAGGERNTNSSAEVAADVPVPYLNGSGLHPDEAAPFAEDLSRGEVPSIRRIRTVLHVGQPRAQEIRARLATLTEGK